MASSPPLDGAVVTLGAAVVGAVEVVGLVVVVVGLTVVAVVVGIVVVVVVGETVVVVVLVRVVLARVVVELLVVVVVTAGLVGSGPERVVGTVVGVVAEVVAGVVAAAGMDVDTTSEPLAGISVVLVVVSVGSVVEVVNSADATVEEVLPLPESLPPASAVLVSSTARSGLRVLVERDESEVTTEVELEVGID